MIIHAERPTALRMELVRWAFGNLLDAFPSSPYRKCTLPAPKARPKMTQSIAMPKNSHCLRTRQRHMTAAYLIALWLVWALPGFAEDVSLPSPDPGSIGGTVLDVNGGVVPGAAVVLRCPSPCEGQSTLASDTGGFEFRKLSLGTPYQIDVSADGFKDWTSPTISLTPDQSVLLLTDVRIQLAETATSVTVYANQERIATEQVHLEEQQRVFGLLPNFYAVYDSGNVVPLSSKLKFKLAMRVARDPVTIAGIGFLAGVQQVGSKPDYGKGAKGYGQRFGAAGATQFSDILIGDAVLPSLLHQDPRYFYQGTGTTKSRLKHALLSPFVCRGDNGRPQVNFSSIGGNLASSALSNTYYPDSNRGAGLVFGNFAIGTVERMASGVLQEFVLRRLTPNAGGHN